MKQKIDSLPLPAGGTDGGLALNEAFNTLFLGKGKFCSLELCSALNWYVIDIQNVPWFTLQAILNCTRMPFSYLTAMVEILSRQLRTFTRMEFASPQWPLGLPTRSWWGSWLGWTEIHHWHTKTTTLRTMMPTSWPKRQRIWSNKSFLAKEMKFPQNLEVTTFRQLLRQHLLQPLKMSANKLSQKA